MSELNEIKEELQELKQTFDKFNKSIEKRIERCDKIDSYCNVCKNILDDYCDGCKSILDIYCNKCEDILDKKIDECSRIINEYLKNSKIKMELKETIELMISDDYNDRFRAEYYQLEVRIDKLQTMLNKYKNNQLDFVPSCSYDLLSKQLEAMVQYRDCLLERAIIEDIDGFFKIKSFRI